MKKKVLSKALVKVFAMLFLLQSILGGMMFTAFAEINYYTNEYFTGSEWQEDKTLDQYTPPAAYTYYSSKGTLTGKEYMMVTTVDSAKALKMTLPNSGAKTYPSMYMRKYYSGTSTTSYPDNFVVEAKISATKTSGWKGIQIRGKSGADDNYLYGPLIIGSNTYIPSDSTTLTGNYNMELPTAHSTDTTRYNFYDIKLVFSKNAQGKYQYDVYTKKDSTITSWVKDTDGTVTPTLRGSDTLTLDNIYAIDLFVMDSGANDETMYTNKFLIYETPFEVSNTTISNNSTISSTTRSVTVTLSEAVNTSTLTKTNIVMKNNGVELSTDKYSITPDQNDSKKFTITYDPLELEKTHTIEFSDGIKTADNRALQSYTLTFTPSIYEYTVDEDFTGGEWTVDAPFNQSGYTLPSAYTYPTTDILKSYMKVTTIDSQKVLKMEVPKPSDSSYPTALIGKSATYPDKFILETKLSASRLGVGTKGIRIFGTVNGVANRFAYGPTIITNNMYIGGRGTTLTGTYWMEAPTTHLNDTTRTNFYDVKLVFSKNAQDKYQYDVYTKKDSTVTSWVKDSDGTVTPTMDGTDDTALFEEITKIELVTFNYDHTNATIETSYTSKFKIYTAEDPAVYTSTITNGQTGVSPNTSSIGITFNQAMNASTITSSNIVLKDVATDGVIQTTGSYNAALREYTMQVPVDAFELGKQYKIVFDAAVKSEQGMSLSTGSDITFTIQKPDAEIVGSIEVTETDGGVLIANLLGKTSAYGKVTLKKNIAEDKDVMIAVALYDNNNTLQVVDYENKTLSGVAGSEHTINDVGITDISPQAGWKVKVFVWDSITSMKPISNQIGQVSATN